MKKTIILIVLACAGHQSIHAAAEMKKTYLRDFADNFQQLNDLIDSEAYYRGAALAIYDDLENAIKLILKADDILTQAYVKPGAGRLLKQKVSLASAIQEIRYGIDTSLNSIPGLAEESPIPLILKFSGRIESSAKLIWLANRLKQIKDLLDKDKNGKLFAGEVYNDIENARELILQANNILIKAHSKRGADLKLYPDVRLGDVIYDIIYGIDTRLKIVTSILRKTS